MMEVTRYAGVLVKCGDKVLLCKRNAKGLYPGMWSLPGGHLEKGESTMNCAKREFFEETDIDIDDMDLTFVGMVPRTSRDGQKLRGLMYVYLLKTETELEPDFENAMDGDEHTDWEYFTLNRIRPERTGTQLHKLITHVMSK
jgi:8-oxo-dGTP pyrophosphatase MutT (NUDIX family)